MSVTGSSPMRSQTTIEKAMRTINDGGNKITFNFSYSSSIVITTLSGDGHACQVVLTSREWYLLNEMRITINKLKGTET